MAGPVSVFHNQDYVGEARLENVSAKEPFQLYLGSDERIFLSRRSKEFRIKTGLFTDTFNFNREIEITVKNRKKQAVLVDLFDRLPLSGDEKIKISDISFSVEPAEEKKKGLYRFRLALEPGEEKKVVIKYHLSHPEGVIPVARDLSGPVW